MKIIKLNSALNSNLDNIFSVYSDVACFYLEKGDYTLTKELEIVSDNIKLIGLTDNPDDVKIRQLTNNKNVLHVRANNASIQNISFYASQGDSVCLSQRNSNWINIEDSIFYGNDTAYSVIFSGSQQNSNVIDAYKNNEFSLNNIFDNNIVYSLCGLCISISFQNYISVRDNLFRGGKLEQFLNRSSIFTHNIFHNSSSHGIFISLPSNDITINNNFIKNTTEASIKVNLSNDYLSEKDTITGIVIENNLIVDCKYIGIEVVNSNNINIGNNILKWIGEFGVFFLSTVNSSISANNIIQSRRGIHIDNSCDNNLLLGNNIHSIYTSISEHAIALEATTLNNTISNNNIYGEYSSVAIKNISDSNTESNNTIMFNISFNDHVLQLL